MGLREICNLVPSFSRALSFFRFSYKASSFVARNIVCDCGFPVGRHFSFSTAGRPSQVWVGRKTASLQQAPVRAGCCVLQGAARPLRMAALLFRLHSVACLSSFGPTVLFSRFLAFFDDDAKGVFGFSRRRRESVWAKVGGQFQAELRPPLEYVRNAAPRCILMHHCNIEDSTWYHVYTVHSSSVVPAAVAKPSHLSSSSLSSGNLRL